MSVAGVLVTALGALWTFGGDEQGGSLLVAGVVLLAGGELVTELRRSAR